MTVGARGRGTRVEYDADLRLAGLLRLGDLVLRLVFKRIGDATRDGLRAKLAVLPAARGAQGSRAA